MASYGYHYKNGGMLGFEGVHADLKDTDGISAEFSLNDTHLTVTVTYADGNVKRLETDAQFIGNDGVQLSEIKKYWNNELL